MAVPNKFTIGMIPPDMRVQSYSATLPRLMTLDQAGCSLAVADVAAVVVVVAAAFVGVVVAFVVVVAEVVAAAGVVRAFDFVRPRLETVVANFGASSQTLASQAFQAAASRAWTFRAGKGLAGRRTVAFAALFVEIQVAPVFRTASLEIVPSAVVEVAVVVAAAVEVVAAVAAVAFAELAVAEALGPVVGHLAVPCCRAGWNLAAALAGSGVASVAVGFDGVACFVAADFVVAVLTVVEPTWACVELAPVVERQIVGQRLELNLVSGKP